MTKKKKAPFEKKNVVGRGPRRSPYELLKALQEKLHALDDLYARKRVKLEDRINALEAKHAEKIAISEMLASKTPEELAADMEAAKHQQALLRKALKQVR